MTAQNRWVLGSSKNAHWGITTRVSWVCICVRVCTGDRVAMPYETGMDMHEDKAGLVGCRAPGSLNVLTSELLSRPLACAVTLLLTGAAV